MQDVDAIAEEIVGLHATNAVSPYLSLLARSADFERRELDERMWGRWQLVRFRAMRLTMFVMPRPLLEVAAAATRHLVMAMGERWLREAGLSREQFDYWADAVDEALEHNPLTVRALRAATGAAGDVPLPGIVGRMCDDGRLVGGRPPHSWTSPVRSYHRWIDVLGDVDLLRWSGGAAIRELVARYVAGYGPVTLSDISWWTGFTKARCRAALESLGGSIVDATVDGWPGPLFVSRAAPRVGSAGVRVLPLLDPYVQGYRDRLRLLDPERHDFVWDPGGNAAPTVVAGGRIIGVWQLADRGVVRYHLFDDHDDPDRGAIETQLARAGEFARGQPVDVMRVSEMPSLRSGPRSAAHPLDGRPHRSRRRSSTRRSTSS